MNTVLTSPKAQFKPLDTHSDEGTEPVPGKLRHVRGPQMVLLTGDRSTTIYAIAFHVQSKL